MPSFADLSPEDLNAVVDYVIFLSQRGELENELALLAQDEEELDPEYVDEIVTGILDRWHEAQAQLVMPLTPMPPFTEESIAKGRELFLGQACNKCHGTNGRTVDGSSVPALAGMPAVYLVEQMKAFKSGTRQATVMHQIAKGYSDQQIEQIAAFALDRQV